MFVAASAKSSGPLISRNEPVHSRNCGTCSSGTPIICAITMLGRIAANSCCASHSPRAARPSISSRAAARARPSTSATRRGVKARDTERAERRVARWVDVDHLREEVVGLLDNARERVEVVHRTPHVVEAAEHVLIASPRRGRRGARRAGPGRRSRCRSGTRGSTGRTGTRSSVTSQGTLRIWSLEVGRRRSLIRLFWSPTFRS